MAMQLTETEIGETLQAMAVVLLARSPVTRDIAERAQITKSGTIAVGVKAAADLVVSALTSHPTEWAEWFEAPANAKSAMSMNLALATGLRSTVEQAENTKGLLATIAKAARDAGQRDDIRHVDLVPPPST